MENFLCHNFWYLQSTNKLDLNNFVDFLQKHHNAWQQHLTALVPTLTTTYPQPLT